MNQMVKTGADIQTISQRDQRQPLAMTAKPEMTGPRAGPEKAALTQRATAMGT